MFAIVRTGGKQYRVAAGDKIAVEKIAGCLLYTSPSPRDS